MDLSTISLVLNLIYLGPITTQFRRDAVLLELLPVEFDGNATLTWDVKYDNRDTAGARAEGYVVQSSDYSTHGREQAVIGWAHYEGYASVSGTAQRVAGANSRYGNPNALMGEEIGDAVKELAVKIGVDAYSGSAAASPREIEGLARAVDATGTYAGLAQGTYDWWASGENTLATASLSIQNIREKLFRPFKDSTGKYPEFVICSGAMWDKVAALFDDSTRIVVDTIQVGDGRGGLKTVQLKQMGARALTIDGVPFIEDRHCTASTFYALHTEFLGWRQVAPGWVSLDPGQIQMKIMEATGDMVDINEIKALMETAGRAISFQINALAKTGDSTNIQLVADFQLRLKRRNAAAKLVLT